MQRDGASEAPHVQSMRNPKPRASEGGARSRQGQAFSLPVTLLMVTLLMMGMMGTWRMRKHALETKGSPLHPVGTVFTPEQLAMYDGRRGTLYLGILGRVYDVTSGKRVYGSGGSYHFFAGRDASRAFVTGKFKEDLTDDVKDLSGQDLSSLIEWRTFYQNHESYSYVGKVVGRFYDDQGTSSPLLAMVEMRAAEYDRQQQERKAAEQSGRVQTCSFKWHKDTGGTVTCGGGTFPRRVYSTEKRRYGCWCCCVCVCVLNEWTIGRLNRTGGGSGVLRLGQCCPWNGRAAPAGSSPRSRAWCALLQGNMSVYA